MVTLVEHYDIHGLVALTIRRKVNRDFVPEISKPFRYFQVESLNREPEIILEIGDFRPNNEGCYLVDHKYFVRENYLYCVDAYKNAHWHMEIEGFEHGPTHIRFSYSYRDIKQVIAPDMFPQALLLKQIISYHLLRKGYFLAHGAATSRNGKAVLLFGRGGTYKTTLLMNLLRGDNNWLPMGDDIVIIGNGRVFSFPVFSGFFAFRYKYLDTEHLSFISRIQMLLYLLTYKSNSLVFLDESQLGWLIRCDLGSSENVSLEKSRLDLSVSQLVKVSTTEDHSSYNIGHISAYPRYVEAYSYIFPDNDVTSRWDSTYSSMLTQSKSEHSYTLKLPNSPQKEHFDKAVQTIEEMITAQLVEI